MTASTGRRAFIVNAGAGSTRDGGWLRENRAAIDAAARGGRVTLANNGEEMSAAADAALAANCDCIVAGGGDGTINAVASRLVGRDATLGVLPLGTLNHFARDLGLPRDPIEALQVIDSGRSVAVDVGEVNGRIFLNNSSLGLYPKIVHHRERQQDRLGRGKWPAFAWATLAALRRYPFLDIRLSLDGGGATDYQTPFLFVGNNAYSMEGMDIGTRASLVDGVLSLYLAQRTGRLGLVRLALHALFRSLSQARDFRELTSAGFVVETRHHRLGVATDGEVWVMETPLRYRSRPGALKVIVAANAQP